MLPLPSTLLRACYRAARTQYPCCGLALWRAPRACVSLLSLCATSQSLRSAASRHIREVRALRLTLRACRCPRRGARTRWSAPPCHPPPYHHSRTRQYSPTHVRAHHTPYLLIARVGGVGLVPSFASCVFSPAQRRQSGRRRPHTALSRPRCQSLCKCGGHSVEALRSTRTGYRAHHLAPLLRLRPRALVGGSPWVRPPSRATTGSTCGLTSCTAFAHSR